MTDNLLSLDRFNSAPVIRSLEIAPDSIAERRAVELVHYMMRDFGPQNAENAEEYFNEVHANVLDKIQFRYNEFKKWAPEFFPPDYEPDLTSLAVAVISDDYIINLGEPTQDEAGNVSEAQYYGINKNVARRAIHIYEGGERLQRQGSLSGQEKEGRKSPRQHLECLFLGHLNVLEMLRAHEARFDKYEVQDFMIILENDYAVARKFINPITAMGDMISNYLDLMQTRMKAKIDEAEVGFVEILDDFRASAKPKIPPFAGEFASAAIPIHKYGADQIPAYFFIDKQETPTVHAAMKYMHRSVKQNSDFAGGNSIEAEQYYTKAAVNFIESRYCIMENYIEDYFEEKPDAALDAIKVAVICDSHIGGVNEPFDAYGDELKFRDDSIDDEIVSEASIFHEEADEMLNEPLPDVAYEEAYPESIFIAHVRGLHDLMDLQESLEDIDVQEAKDWLENRLPAIQKFLLPDTNIGTDILPLMEECEKSLHMQMERYEQYMTDRYGTMRIAHDNPHCESTGKRAGSVRLVPNSPDLAP